MNRIIFSLLIFISLYSCDNNDDNIESIKLPKKKVQPKKSVTKATPSFIPITDKTAIERLTEYGKTNTETIVDIYTSKGKIRIKLYEDTPLHRSNFILLAKSGYLKGCLFSRVVPDFMAQCGGSYDEAQKRIQDSIGSYSIPNEIMKHHFHKKGAIGMARSYTNNPNKNSECDEFYFVEGTKYSDLSLDHYEDLNKYKFNSTQRNYYKNNKGAAHIDGEHTVFGEIISGYNIVSKLTHVKRDTQDWPNTDMYIDSVKIIK